MNCDYAHHDPPCASLYQSCDRDDPAVVVISRMRLTLDFVRLNAATGGLEGWPIPNIQQTLSRLGTMKPTVFGLLDPLTQRRDISRPSWLWENCTSGPE